MRVKKFLLAAIMVIMLLSLFLELLATAQQTSSAGGNQTDLLTSRSIASDSGSLTNMLVVTTTVRMVYGVHGNTTSSGPAVTLSLVLVEGTTSLEQRLVNTTTTSDDTDGSTGAGGNNLLGTGGELDASLTVLTVTDDGSVVTRGTGKSTTVTSVLLNIADDGTFGHGGKGKDIANGEGSLLSAVDELTSVHTLSSDEGLGTETVLVLVTEDDLGERSTTTGVVDDFLDDTANIAVALSIIERSQLGSTLTVSGVRLEDSSRLSLSTNDATHF